MAGRLPGAGMRVVTHEDYLAAVAEAVCEQYPATAALLSEVELGSGRGRGGEDFGHGTGWAGRGSGGPAAAGGDRGDRRLKQAATCHVVLHELGHVLAPGFGHGREWRYAARQVGC